MQRSLIPGRIQSIRVSAWEMRARVSLALAERGGDRAELLRVVARDAHRLAREDLAHASARALALRAASAHLQGDRASAVRGLRDSIAAFTALDMALNASVLRSVLGALVEGDEGRALRDAAATWFASQSVKRPERFVAMMAPGFGDATSS